MIRSIILLSTFYRDDVTNAFYNANDLLFSHAVSTDRTNIAIGYIETTLAEFYFATHFADHFTELYYIIVVLLEKMQYQTQSGFFTDTGKFGEFVNRIFEKRRGKLHFVKVQEKSYKRQALT